MNEWSRFGCVETDQVNWEGIWWRPQVWELLAAPAWSVWLLAFSDWPSSCQTCPAWTSVSGAPSPLGPDAQEVNREHSIPHIYCNIFIYIHIYIQFCVTLFEIDINLFYLVFGHSWEYRQLLHLSMCTTGLDFVPIVWVSFTVQQKPTVFVPVSHNNHVMKEQCKWFPQPLLVVLPWTAGWALSRILSRWYWCLLVGSGLRYPGNAPAPAGLTPLHHVINTCLLVETPAGIYHHQSS